MYLLLKKTDDCSGAGQKPHCASRTGPKEATMFDSFSEGTVYYGRTFLVLGGAIVLAILATLL